MTDLNNVKSSSKKRNKRKKNYHSYKFPFEIEHNDKVTQLAKLQSDQLALGAYDSLIMSFHKTEYTYPPTERFYHNNDYVPHFVSYRDRPGQSKDMMEPLSKFRG